MNASPDRRQLVLPLRASVVAVVLLLAATVVGSAGAARVLLNGALIKPGTVASSQIANNSVQGVDVRAATLTESDLAPAVRTKLNTVGAAGPAGANGATGGVGATGPRGFSAWDTIPSGVTVRGVVHWEQNKPTNGLLTYVVPVTLPGISPVALTHATVNFKTGYPATDGDATCTGSSTAPTAPAGKVCLYVHSGLYVTSVSGWVDALATQSFFVRLTTDVEIDPSLIATWAYTAP